MSQNIFHGFHALDGLVYYIPMLHLINTKDIPGIYCSPKGNRLALAHGTAIAIGLNRLGNTRALGQYIPV